MRAVALVLLMLASTQLVLLTGRDHSPGELGEGGQRSEVDNSQVTIIDLGAEHACAIGTANQMKCWGDGASGKTGHENTDDYGDEEEEMGQYLMFTDVGPGLTFTDVAAGDDFTCALLSDASVKCWGSNEYLGSEAGAAGTGSKGDGYREMGAGVERVRIAWDQWNATSISAGGSHACAITNNGTSDSLVCWGDNTYGQLGIDPNYTSMGGTTLHPLAAIPFSDIPSRGVGLSQVAVGGHHTCLLWSDGEVGCWGNNSYGQLGIGSTDHIGDNSGEMGSDLTLVSFPSGRTAAQISAGHDVSCAILDNDDLACWGNGAYGMLGSEGTQALGDSPGEIGDGLHVLDLGSGYAVESVSIGNAHSCAILDDGDATTSDELKCWGSGFGGALGQGDQDSWGHAQYTMGNYLPVLSLGSDVHPIYVEAGDSFTCAIMNNTKVKCWGSGLGGRTGLGISGNFGDQTTERGDNMPYVELYLPEESFDRPCDEPAEGSPLATATLDSTNSMIGNQTSTAMTPDSCAAVAYVDGENEAPMFAVFNKGRWSTEIISSEYSGWNLDINDIALTIDSNGTPHIVVGASHEARYWTKEGGVWVSDFLATSFDSGSGSDGNITAVSVETGANGDIFAIWQEYRNSGGPNNRIRAMGCTAAAHADNSCSDPSAGGFDLNAAWQNPEASFSAAMDTDVASDGTIIVAYVEDDDYDGTGSVKIVELGSGGFGTPINTGGTVSVPWDSDYGSGSSGEFSMGANSSLAMDIGLDGSIHTTHLDAGGGLHHSWCSSGCDSLSSWSTEELDSSYETGVIDISMGPDLSTVILAGTDSGTYTLHKKEGGWEYTSISSTGGADWMAVEISEMGKMWGFAYYPGTSAPLTHFRQEGMTTSGLNEDIDGDGWSRLDEIRCGTDYTNSSSIPSDSDGDGECDLLDGWVDSSISGESDALSIGEEFGCAVLANYSVACWGDNSEGQLGNSGAGSSSPWAVLVDLPAGFEAGAIDAGTAHACSTGLDGTLVCWGRNTAGQLGRGSLSASGTPGYATIPSGVSVEQFAAGADHNCMKGTDSKLYCWGEGDKQRLGLLVDRLTIEGFDDNSRDWVPSYANYVRGPAQGFGYLDWFRWGNWATSSMQSGSSFNVSSGDEISFKLRARNFGDNGGEWLKVYLNDTLISQIPGSSTYSSSSFSDWQDISFTVPDSYSSGSPARIKFEVYGRFFYMNVDDLVVSPPTISTDDAPSPTEVYWSQAEGISQISLGTSHSCVLIHGGEVSCWGDNGGAYGNVLGNSSFTGPYTYEPQSVDLTASGSLVASEWTGGSPVAISSGDGVTCAIMQSTESLCWGRSSETTYRDPVTSNIASEGDVGRSPALTTDSEGNWIIAYNDGSGISYARFDGTSWSTTDICSTSDACDSDKGVGIGEGPDGGVHFLSYDEAADELVHTRALTNLSTTAPVTDEDPKFFNVQRDPASGVLHLTYYQESGRKLMHKTFNSTGWSDPVLIDDDQSYTGHSWNGMRIDSSGNLHLSYWSWQTSGTDDTWLKYALYNGTSWTTQTLQSIMNQNGPTLHTSLDLDSGDNPHISYYDHKNDTLRYTYYNGTAWVDQTLTVDDSNDNGMYNSIALDSSDRPRISYRNHSSYDLELISWNGTNWNREVVDSSGNVGSWTSIAIDGSDLSKIAYYYDSGSDLRYASHDGASWSIRDIDTSTKSSKISLDLDSSDRPRIGYQSSDSDAMIAYNNSGSGDEWQTIEVWDSFDVGSHMSITLDYDSGTAFMAYRQNDWPADGGLLTTFHTGTEIASDGVASSGDASNSVGMAPGIHFSGSAIVSPFLNGTDGASPTFIEMAKLRSEEPEITTVEGESSSVGSYGISMALDSSGNQHISFYNNTDSSLMYAAFDGTSWEVEEVDNEGSTGRYSSIAVDHEGNPHIAYVNESTTPRQVLYAHHNGTSWSTEVVDTPYYAYDTSIELGSDGTTHITYAVYNSSGNHYNLRYSYHNGTEWVQEDVMDYGSTWSSTYSGTGRNSHIKLNGTGVPHVVFYDDATDDVYLSIRSNGSWSSTSVDDFGGYYTTAERSISLAIDSLDGLHVAYYDMSSRLLEYAHREAGGSSWAKAVVHDQGNHYIATSVSIAVDRSDMPHIAYHDRSQKDLEYARFDGTSWIVETLDAQNDVGRFPNIAIDEYGHIHIAYENDTQDSIKSMVIGNGMASTEKVSQVGTHSYGLGYAVSGSGATHLSFYNGSDSAGTLQHAQNSGSSWSVVTVDDSSAMVGTYSDIALDSSGNPHISYVDATNGLLRYAQFDGADWTLSTVDASGSVIGHTSIVVDGDGNPRISYHDGDLRLAVWDGSSWSLTTQDTGAGQGSQVSLDGDGITRIAYFDEDDDDLLFSLAGHDSPVVMGSSTFHRSGTSMDSGATSVTSLSIGQTHACAVVSDAVRCWGVASSGQLGNGVASVTSEDPVPSSAVSGLTPLEVSVSPSKGTGGGFSCALYSVDSSGDRRILCWGQGSSGEIGGGSSASANSPDSANPVSLEGGIPLGAAESSGALSSSPYDVAEISIDNYGMFGCARSVQGHIKCWGYNNYGQLGHGNTSTASDGPNEMGANLAFVPLGSNRTSLQVSVGAEHACALLDNGSVKCWGRNQNGVTGQGTTSGNIGDESEEMGDDLPVIDLGAGRTATEISSGSYHTCAILEDGSVKCWGKGGSGRLGIGNSSNMGDGANEMGDYLPAVDLGTGRTAISISSGNSHTCAILDSGVVKCWGLNTYGQLGQGHNYPIGDGYGLEDGIQCHPTLNEPTDRECLARMGDGLPAVDLGDDRTAVQISAGHSHTCAILDNGSVRCWGSNGIGRTGLGTGSGNTGDSSGEMGDNLPTVDLGSGKKASSISAGYSHTCALLNDLSVACWGGNGEGALGIGSTDHVGDSSGEMGDSLQAADLPTTTSSSVIAGFYHSCGIMEDGTVRCWGQDDNGRLGVYRDSNNNIGDSGEEMGNSLPITNLYIVPNDYDGDGWIDIWDTDDDDDGYTDTNDDLPFDERDWFDHDGDGLGVNVDTDDDDATVTTADQDTATKWSDEEEIACGTLWWSALSEPTDYDGDGICDSIDDDIDGNSWNDTYQIECYGGEPLTWSQRDVWDSAGLIWPTSNYDSISGGYDFTLSDHGIRFFSTYNNDYSYYALLRFDGSTDGISSVYGSNEYDYWSVNEQNNLLYVTDEAGMFRAADSNGTLSLAHRATGGSTTSTDTAISIEGDMVARWYEGSGGPAIRGWYLNGTTFQLNVPEGLSASSNHHGQLAFGPNGRLHVMMVNLSASPVGFYHYHTDLGPSHSGSTTVEWSSPRLILDRSQSSSWSSGTQHSATQDHTSDLHVSSDGTVYAAMYNDTDLWFSTFDGSVWNSEMVSSSTGRNEGVRIATNSSGTPHLAWINHTSDILMLSHKSGDSWVNEQVWQSNGWEESSGVSSLSYASLSLRFDRQDDPFLMSIDANDTGSAILHHKGLLLDPSYYFEPTDQNGDGVCDTLQYAVADYGTDSVVTILGEDLVLTPEFSGQSLIEVWAPSLPAGLSLNNTTGVISGAPTSTDTAGTAYTLYSNSSSASYPVTITFTIRSPSPVHAGFGRVDDHQYMATRNGPGTTFHEYDSEGNLYYYGLYHSTSAWSSDGISVSIQSGDLYVAKRWGNGTWAWVMPLDFSGSVTGGPGGLAIDGEGNAYVTGHRSGGSLDLPGTGHDLPSREAMFVVSVDTNGSVRWAHDAYMSTGGTDANWHISTDTVVNTYGFTRMDINGETEELTIAGQVSSSSSSERTLSFGNITLEIPESKYSYQRPFITRMNSTSGNFSWVSTVTPGTNYHRTLQGMAVQEDGSVDVLMRTYGSTTLGNLTVGPDNHHYVLARLNDSGEWSSASTIVSEDPAGFDVSDDSAMMAGTSTGDLVFSFWTISDTSRLNVTGSVNWFNDTCADSMIVMRLDGTEWNVEASKEYCLTEYGGRQSEYYSQLHVDSEDRIWLFLGSRYTNIANHNRILRLDSGLNPDFEEYIEYSNSPSNAFQLDWDDVAFDPLGNVLVTLYTSQSSLYWDDSYLSRTSSSWNYQNQFFMESVGHSINGATLVAGEGSTLFGVTGLSAMGATCDQGSSYCDEFLDNWATSGLPAGLSIDSDTGLISGAADGNMSLGSFALWMNDSKLGDNEVNVSFSILDGRPTVTYNQTVFVFERGTEIVPIVPTEISGSIVNWTTVPELPAGLFLGDSNGTIYGTPTVNLSSSTFQLRVSSEGATRSINFNFTINEPVATIAYGNGSYIIPRDTLVDIAPTLGGGFVETFEINSTEFPLGLSFNTTNGHFQGIPLLFSDNLTYTVWANNSGGSNSTEVSIWIIGNGITLSFPTTELVLVEGTPMQPISGQTSGSTPESWAISPELPNGLIFGSTNGTIWGTPASPQNLTNYTIWANATGGQTSSVTLSIVVLVDTDGDGIPDITDDDDDNDGWNDTAEIGCGTDPLNSSSVPSDTDDDGICDSLDDTDDRAIALAYPENILELVVNVSVVSLTPVTSGGTITSWEVSPDLPPGLHMDNSTGVVNGTPTTVFNGTDFVIWANNSAYSASFTLNISSSLIDTDGDGIPDITDDDDDGDGWADSDETACSTGPLDEDEYPTDGDGDGLCDLLDSVDDSPILLAYGEDQVNLTTNVTTFYLPAIVFGGDVRTWEILPELPDGITLDSTTGGISGVSEISFEPTNFTVWANNSQHNSSFAITISSIPLDSDSDGIPDETDPDDDNDGWNDTEELDCLTGQLDPLSYPTDEDGDGVCDGQDGIDDSPIFLVYSSTSQLLFVNEPINPLIGTTYGGDVRTWEIWPPLPAGLTLNGAVPRTGNQNGTITGAPMEEFEMQIFTVWANNSQYNSSVEITLQSVIPDPDDTDFDIIYLQETLSLTTNIDEVYLEPQIFGGNVSSWSISPELPEGMLFNESNGLITGSITVEVNQSTHTISASNALFLNTFEITITSAHLDTDGDGIPDIFDPDDDGDGWNDTVEVDCETDPLDIVSSPDDYDGDGTCDLQDEFDDSPIVFFYPVDKLVLTVGEEMEPLDPLIAPTSGGIMFFTVVPDMPKGLILDNETGVISGTPTEGYRHILVEYSHTFTASNSQWSFSYRVDFDIFPPLVYVNDTDGDGWWDEEELECNTDPDDNASFPEDIDMDGICSHKDEDDDGDKIGDLIDAFPKDPTAWDDTDNDSRPDELTCRFLTDSANCSFVLEEDFDDDNDGWLDLNETSCGTDPKDNMSVPEDDDGDGVCNLLEEYVPNTVRILWICCFPLLLLLLMLLWLLNPFSVDEEEIMDPEPEYTFTEREWQGGSGEYDDPFVLRPVKGVRPGSFAESHELIKVSNITPRLSCDFTDMSAERNGSRFSMRPIKSTNRGEIEFRLQFRDDDNTTETTVFEGLIRLGKATVYFLWDVEVEVIRDTPEEVLAKRNANRIEREAKKKAAELERDAAKRAADAEVEAKKKALEAEREAKEKLEEIENAAAKRAIEAERKAAEAERRAAELEEEARKKAAELEKEAEKEAEQARKEAEELEEAEQEARRESERREAELAEKKRREVEEEEAAARALLRKKAEERRAAEEAARIEKEEEERAAEEEAARIEKEEEERAARLEREAEERLAEERRAEARKKAEEEAAKQRIAVEAQEKLRKKAIERKRQKDEREREMLASREKAERRTRELEKSLDERRARLADLDAEARKKEAALLRISEKAKSIDFGVIGFATEDEKDNLQTISGVGPFIEEKLNALGIFSFKQISKMTPEMEDAVNDAIEFFPGRVRRDEWAKQAKTLSEGEGSGEDGQEESEEERKRASEILRKAQERKLAEEAEKKIMEATLRREKAREIQRNKENEGVREEFESLRADIEERRSRLEHLEGRERAKEEALLRIADRADEVDFVKIGFSSRAGKDELQQIDGITKLIESKLNVIGIYSFSQIAKMSDEIVEKVSDIIGLGPGRILRDEWVEQAILLERRG